MGYALGEALGWITAIAVVISVGSYVLSLGVGLAVITSTQLATQLSVLNGHLTVYAFLLSFRTPLEVNGLWLVILSIIIFVICFIKAASTNGRVISGHRLLLPRSNDPRPPHSLANMPIRCSRAFL